MGDMGNTHIDDGPAVYTIHQVADRWQCSAGQVTNLCRTGALGHFRTGHTKGIRISAAHLAAHLAAFEAGQAVAS